MFEQYLKYIFKKKQRKAKFRILKQSSFKTTHLKTYIQDKGDKGSQNDMSQNI